MIGPGGSAWRTATGALVAAVAILTARHIAAQTAGTATPAPAPAAGAAPRVADIRAMETSVRPVVNGKAAFVVSEVTVKKVTDAKELDRLREALKGVDQSNFRLQATQKTSATAAPKTMTVGTLPLADVARVSTTSAPVAPSNAAFVVAEVTVKKVTDTKELDRIRDVLRNVDATDRTVQAVRLEPVSLQ